MNINSLPSVMTTSQASNSKQSMNVAVMKKAKEAQQLEGQSAVKLIDSAKPQQVSSDPMRGNRINTVA